MTPNTLAATAVIFVCLGLATGAGAETVQKCVFDAGGAQGNWIGAEIYLSHEPGSDQGEVIDGVIAYYNSEQPVPARVATDNAKRTTYAWDLRVKDIGGQNATMSYRMTIMKATQKAQITAQALGYVGPFTAQGRCVPV
jgi:hypothetical protein